MWAALLQTWCCGAAAVTLQAACRTSCSRASLLVTCNQLAPAGIGFMAIPFHFHQQLVMSAATQQLVTVAWALKSLAGSAVLEGCTGVMPIRCRALCSANSTSCAMIAACNLLVVAAASTPGCTLQLHSPNCLVTTGLFGLLGLSLNCGDTTASNQVSLVPAIRVMSQVPCCSRKGCSGAGRHAVSHGDWKKMQYQYSTRDAYGLNNEFLPGGGSLPTF